MRIQKIVTFGLVLALCTGGLVGCTGGTGGIDTSATASTTQPTTLSSVQGQGESNTSSTGDTTAEVRTSENTTTSQVAENGVEPTDYFELAPSSDLVEDYLEGVEGLQPYQTQGGLNQAGGEDYKIPHLKSDSADAKLFNDTMAQWALTARMSHDHIDARQGTVFRNRYTAIEYGDYVSILVKRITQNDLGMKIEWGTAYVYDKKNERFLNFREILAAGGVKDSGEFVASIEDDLVNLNLVTDQYPYEDGMGTNNLKMENSYTLTYAWALGYRPKGINPWYYLDSDQTKAGFVIEGEGVFMPPVSVFLDSKGEICIMHPALRIVTQNPGEEMKPAKLVCEMRTWRYADASPRDGAAYDLAYQNACKLTGIENPMDGPEAFVVYLGNQESREPYARTQWVVDLVPNYNKHDIFDVIKSVYYSDEEYYAIIPKNRKTAVVVMPEGKEFVGLSTIGSTIVGVAKGQRLGLWYRDKLIHFSLENDGNKVILDPDIPVVDLSERIPDDQPADDEMMDFLRIFNLGRG